MRSIRRFALILAMCCVTLATWGCDEPAYDPTGPVPEVPQAAAPRAYTQADVDAMVIAQQQSIHNPAPRENGVPPEACDTIRFMRYRLNDTQLGLRCGPGMRDHEFRCLLPTAEYADAGLLIVPGVLEGANGFEYFARQLVYIAKREYGLNIEVWAMDRRNNCLEDRAGLDAAEKTATAAQAEAVSKGYYYEGQAIGGKTFDGFLHNDDLPFLSEFGLKMDTEDMLQIIRTMVPSQEDRRRKVFVGGHSLGGLHTSMFAGWDFDGNPATLGDAGFNNAAGLFALDSTLAPTNELVDSVLAALMPRMPQGVITVGKSLTAVAYATALRMLRKGTLPRFIEGDMAESFVGSPIDPEIMAVLEAIAIMAYLEPEEEFTAIHSFPMSVNQKETLRRYVARDQAHYDSETPDVLDFRYTNAAFLGMLFDDDTTHLTMIRASMGFMYNGAIVPKADDLKLSEGLFAAVDAGPDLNHLGQGPIYKWADFDQIATADDPLFQDTTGTLTYTEKIREVSSIRDVARALHKGPTNLVEWYFSLRRLLDIMAAIMNYGPRYGLNFLHPDKVATLPCITFGAGDGMFSENAVPFGEFVRLEGFDHMDPMFASANTPTHRKNEVIYPLLDFVAKNRR